MKKIEQITIKAVPEHTKEIEIYSCDFCGYETKHNNYGAIQNCSICKRHACKDCRKSDPEDWSDYPNKFCNICIDLRYKKYKKEIDDLEEKFYNENEAIIERIRVESLSQPPPEE